MQRKTLVLFIGTIVVFFLLIGAALLIIMLMPPEVVEEDIQLDKYFREKKQKILDSVKNVKFVSVQDYIKDPDNPVPGINRALGKSNYVVFPSTFHGKLNGMISVPNNTIIKFEEGVKLYGVDPSIIPPGEQCLFSLYGVHNVTIIGNNAIIDTSEAAHGSFPTICMHGAKDVFIMDLSLIKPVGYGVAVSRFTHQAAFNYPSERIELFNIQINSAKNGGLLVQSVNTLKVYKLVVEKSAGGTPENGVTVAAENSYDSLTEVHIQDLVTTENKGVGLEIIPSVSLEKKFTIVLKGYNSTFDGEFAPIYLRNSPKDGKITLKKLDLTHREGISSIIRTWDTRNSETDVFRSKLNGGKDFVYIVTDRKSDPFESNLENLNINS